MFCNGDLDGQYPFPLSLEFYCDQIMLAGHAMAILKTRDYIALNPRFVLSSSGIPNLQRGQMTLVYESLTPFPEERSLEELAIRCSAQNYEKTYKKPIPPIEAPIFLRKSILYHLKRMQERGIIREVEG